MKRSELIDLVILLIDDNNAKEIDYARMRSVIENFIDTVLPEATAEEDGRVPYVSGEEYTSSDVLKVISGVVNAKKLKLEGGIAYADYIYNSGTMPINRATALPTLRYLISRTPRATGTISLPVDLTNELRVGETITLDGGQEHTIAEGDTFVLRGQTDPDENIPYTAVASDEVPVVADWYEATKNQEIAIDYGPSSKQVMPAVEEGETPVVLPDNGDLAFQFFVINNF